MSNNTWGKAFDKTLKETQAEEKQKLRHHGSLRKLVTNDKGF